MDGFFTEVKGENGEKITVLNEKSPKENFPYLFNPSYSYSENERKKWIAFRVLEESEKTVGYIFIHLFRGVFTKRRVKKVENEGRRQPIKVVSKSMPVFLFLFIGERSYIQYIKTEIEVISTKFPLEIIDMEY